MNNLRRHRERVTVRLVCFLIVSILIVGIMPITVTAAPSFTAAMQNRFVAAILEFGGAEYDFNRYALHDFDGDGIPELLMGGAHPQDQMYCSYNVLKYDTVGDRFVTIGYIAQSRYLMRDRYSNALIAMYQDVQGGSAFKIYKNHYIANGVLSRNTILAHLGGNNNSYIYDGATIYSGYYVNDISVSKERFDRVELNLRGSYDEVIVHDMWGFDYEVALIAVRTWKPVIISNKPITFTSADSFTKTWQMPMYDLIKAKLGPASTYFGEYDINIDPKKEDYRRFALYDIDGDGVPELFLGVLRGTKMSFDVYRYWNGDMQFIGSFDSYSKYLAKAPGGVFAFNPAPNMFHEQAALKVSFVNNSIKTDTLLMSYYKNDKYHYLAPDGAGKNLISVSYSNYTSTLVRYVTTYAEIKTFDIEMVPPSAALIMYVKTKGFTIQ